MSERDTGNSNSPQEWISSVSRIISERLSSTVDQAIMDMAIYGSAEIRVEEDMSNVSPSNSYQLRYTDMLQAWPSNRFIGEWAEDSPAPQVEGERMATTTAARPIYRVDQLKVGDFLANRGLIRNHFSSGGADSDGFNKFLDYISFIQTNQSIDLTGAMLSDFPSAFVNNNTSNIYFCALEKPKINMEVEGYLDKLKLQNAQATPNFELPESMKVRIREAVREQTQEQIRELKEQENNFLRNLTNYNNVMHEKWKELFNVRASMKAMEGDGFGDDVFDKIKAVALDPFWTFTDFVNGLLRFTTSQPVSMRYVDARAGVDISVTFGKFVGSIRLSDGEIRVSPASITENLNAGAENSNMFHPHINSGNRMCYGNASETITRAISSLSVDTIFTVIKNILVTYNPESPWVQLYRFRDEALRRTNAQSQAIQVPQTLSAGTADGYFDADIEAPEETGEEEASEDWLGDSDEDGHDDE